MPRAKNKPSIATLDAETDPFEWGAKIDPFVWGFFDGETFSYFWGDTKEQCCEKLLKFLHDEFVIFDQQITIYAHNGGKFDFMFLLENFDAQIMLINGRIAKATMFDGLIEFRDSWLIIPIKLDDYEKDKIDYQKFTKENRNIHKNEIIRYLRKDCSALYELVFAFVNRFGFVLTLASTAFKELRATGYEIKNTNEGFDSKLRDYYYGGRVQCFDVGNFYGNFKYVDINSAYPYAMTFKHWYGSGFMLCDSLPEKPGSWFARIRAVSRGALPYRFEQKLYFPNDNKPRWYNASGWEIIAGLETGTLDVLEVERVYKPTLTQDFTPYVDKFFAEKKAAEERGDKIGRLFAKLLLNSCYGKFGQDGRNFKEYRLVGRGEWPQNDARAKYRWQFNSDTPTGQTFFFRDNPQYRFYNVATAASVTGFVRAYLWRAILQSEGALYCDTDSIICRDFHGKQGKALGEWDLEAELIEAHIAQRKMYALKLVDGSHKIASKGVRLDFDTIKSGIAGALSVTHKKDAPAYSIKYGPRYFSKEIDFANLQKNIVTNPD